MWSTMSNRKATNTDTAPTCQVHYQSAEPVSVPNYKCHAQRSGRSGGGEGRKRGRETFSTLTTRPPHTTNSQPTCNSYNSAPSRLSHAMYYAIKMWNELRRR